MKEGWRDITEYEGIYQASDQGKVRSLDRIDILGRFRKGRILKQSRNKTGYLHLNLCKYNKVKNYYAHDLILITFDRSPRSGEVCNHIDGNKDNNYRSNLEWCTQLENIHHAIENLGWNEKKAKGGECNKSELTDQKVREIKNLLKQKILSQRGIAKRYNVHFGTIRSIKLGKSWGHIKI